MTKPPGGARKPVGAVVVRGLKVLGVVLLLGGCTHFSKRSVTGACESNLDSGILNFCVVTPEVLWRGAELDPRGAAWLIQHGVRTIVNLELTHDDRSALIGARIADLRKFEVNYFQLRNWQPLALVAPALLDDRVARFIAIIARQPKPVYVHCLYGLDRTGVMIAAYRILVEGASEESAIEEMARYHEPWFRANARYLRGLVPERREKIRREVLRLTPLLASDARIVCERGDCRVAR